MKIARSLLLPALVLFATAIAASPAVAVTKTLPPLTPAQADGLTRALSSGRLTDAQYALERARSLFRPAGVRARFGAVEVAPPDAATFILRDLAAREDELGPSERRQAREILARPTDPGDSDAWSASKADRRFLCTTRFCIHWVTTANDPDKPPAGDTNPNNGIPDWIDTTVATVDQVLEKEVDQLGFPMPKNDSTSGSHNGGNPNGKLDIYLADIGDDGLYGYCASDDPNNVKLSYRYFDASAFCVLDNDFRPDQFFGVSGQNANRVTIAHEVHHAEQFALDWVEDVWIMEADATLMEHVVYPGIHDNYQYLFTSPITEPGVPLDLSNPNRFNVYGDWIFLQYLSQHVGGPGIMWKIWKRLDGSKGGPDQYSIQGVANAIAAQGHPFSKQFVRFVLANRHYRNAYALNGLPSLSSPTEHRYSMGRKTMKRSGVWKSHHLAARWYSFRPGKHGKRHARLHLHVDLPNRSTGPQARAIVIRKSGKRFVHAIRLNRKGEGGLTVRFGRRRTKRVDFVFVSTGRHYRCGLGSYSCNGKSRDDHKPYSFVAKLR